MRPKSLLERILHSLQSQQAYSYHFCLRIMGLTRNIKYSKELNDYNAFTIQLQIIRRFATNPFPESKVFLEMVMAPGPATKNLRCATKKLYGRVMLSSSNEKSCLGRGMRERANRKVSTKYLSSLEG
jgi:hypothetical protein